MRTYVVAFVSALVVCAALTPIVRWMAFRMGAVSTPGGRHVHERAIPRLGGVGIAVAFSVPVLTLFLFDRGVALSVHENATKVLGLLAGAVLLCVTGFVDDTRGLRAANKLTLQLVAATIAFSLGFRIDTVYLPLLGNLPMGVFAYPVTVLWIVGITNAVNLIDGLDGLAAGVVFFAAATNLVVAILSGATLMALLMASLMGAVVGFLIYNFNPARIFMGDSGSYFLGFVLATTSLIGSTHKASTAVSLLVPILALGVPIFDTLFSMVRRILERRSIFSPDRGHIHHRLLDLGLSHRRAVLILYGVSAAFTAAAIAVSFDRRWQTGLALVVASTVLITLVRWVGYFDYVHRRKRQQQRFHDVHTERLRRALPELLRRLEGSGTIGEVWRHLEWLGERTELHSIELLSRHSDQVVWTWTTSTTPRNVSTRFPVGSDAAARSEVKFTWQSDTAQVPETLHMLMQVSADALEGAFSRCLAELAPQLDSDALHTPDPSDPPTVAQPRLPALGHRS
jgi:UDP-GlcNAc:undecaprenyl-phosphate/decaprenyl-phosphate GlcNAc-1-phosphate transferase